MRIPTWRIALTGGAVVLLLGLGIGFVAASSAAPTAPANAAQPAPTTAPGASAVPGRPGFGGFRKWLTAHNRLAAGLGGAKRLVHATATFTDKDGNLVTIQLDHGTIQSIGDGRLVIAEAGGSTVTVSTDADTTVHLGHDTGTLGDLKIGDTVFVQSRVDATTLAKRIVQVRATDTGS